MVLTRRTNMRLIDADKANVDYIHCFYGSECKLDDVKEWLNDQPTVNPYEWVSIKDRLPEKDGKYIVARKEGNKYSISVRKFQKEIPCCYCGHWERGTNGITHWMLLPEPPIVEEN